LRYASAYVILVLALCAPVNAQDSEDVPPSARQGGSAGIEILSGAEFQQLELEDGREIDKISVPLTARLTTGRLRFTAQMPYLRVSGPENVVVPSGPLGLPILVDPTRPAEVRTREGIGDARVGVAYDVGLPAINLSLNAGAKLPTASAEKGLGTGAADYWIGADVSTTLGAITPFAAVNYTKMGDGEGFELEDTISGQAGAALRLGSSTSAHLGYSYTEAASDVSPNEQRLFGGVNTAVAERISLGLYGSAGVAGPADVGAGISLGVGFN
jgi:hypothetical protein